MSGVVSNYWALSESADHLELAYKIANDLGEPKTTYEELVEFFKFAPAEKLIEYSTAVKYSPLLQIVFNPVIESETLKLIFQKILRKCELITTIFEFTQFQEKMQYSHF